MAASDRAQLFSRLQELRSQQGMGWKEIARIVVEEGYREGGKSLTDNALRKRYARWVEAEGVAPPTSEPVSTQEQGGHDTEQPQKNRIDSCLKQIEGAALPALLPEDAIVSSIAGPATLNSQLLEQIRESSRLMQRLEKRLEESKTSHTERTGEQLVTSRDLLELLKEITSRREQMQWIEEQRRDYVGREEVRILIEESIQDRVNAELRIMLEGEPVKSLVSQVLDERLKAYMGGITVKETHSARGGADPVRPIRSSAPAFLKTFLEK